MRNDECWILMIGALVLGITIMLISPIIYIPPNREETICYELIYGECIDMKFYNSHSKYLYNIRTYVNLEMVDNINTTLYNYHYDTTKNINKWRDNYNLICATIQTYSRPIMIKWNVTKYECLNT